MSTKKLKAKVILDFTPGPPRWCFLSSRILGLADRAMIEDEEGTHYDFISQFLSEADYREYEEDYFVLRRREIHGMWVFEVYKANIPEFKINKILLNGRFQPGMTTHLGNCRFVIRRRKK